MIHQRVLFALLRRGLRDSRGPGGEAPGGRRSLVRRIGVVVALSALGVGAAAAQEAVTMIAGDVQRDTFRARSAGRGARAADLILESAALDVALPSGRPYRGYLISVHEPRSGLFWWTFQGAGRWDPTDRVADLRERFTFFVSRREIVGLQVATPPPSIWISRSTAKVRAAAEGRRRALEALARTAGRIEDGSARWLQDVNLWNVLPADFFYHPYDSSLDLEMQIAAIGRRTGGWVVTLTGREDRTAEVVLDRLFVLVRAEITSAASGEPDP